mmetsp:Transcript_34490/g.108289  ORF Transcript_34490/g.108289 Transcript_34490/m.108289 type:complete len:148 (-) Transcript_34490:848-1291(-)
MSLVGGLGQSRLISARSRRRLGLAMSLGGMTGQLLAGLLGPRLGWRAPFVPVGGLMLLLAASVRRLLPEPVRGRAGPSATPHSQEGPPAPHGLLQCIGSLESRRGPPPRGLARGGEGQGRVCTREPESGMSLRVVFWIHPSGERSLP